MGVESAGEPAHKMQSLCCREMICLRQLIHGNPVGTSNAVNTEKEGAM
jgi:hypothetical protein